MSICESQRAERFLLALVIAQLSPGGALILPKEKKHEAWLLFFNHYGSDDLRRLPCVAPSSKSVPNHVDMNLDVRTFSL